MKRNFFFAAGLAMVSLLVGCETVPQDPNVKRGPHGTIAYDVLVEASEPGARVEVNGEVIGDAPLRVQVWGDKDGTFHDFGSYVYVIRALPLTTNQFVQTRVFGTGRGFSHQDKIPDRVYFDMQQNNPVYGPDAGPGYPYPAYGPYYGPSYYYYGPPYYYGPAYRFYYGPRYHYRYH